MWRISLAILLFAVSCAPAATPADEPTHQVISVFTSQAAQPWLTDVYNCAEKYQITIDNNNDPSKADVTIRFGEAAASGAAYAYQIGSDDLVIITNRESPAQNMSQDALRSLFANPVETGSEVWVYSPGDDIQRVFMDGIMRGTQITSLAHLATSPQLMSDAVNSGKTAVGYLPRRWKAGTVREVFVLAKVPLLALTKTEPQGALNLLIGCLAGAR